MIIGYQSQQHILQKFFDRFVQGKGIPFLLLAGPNHIGKTTLILQYIKQLLGKWIVYDFLHIQDFSEQLGKSHTLKIDTPKKGISEDLKNEYQYEDKGMRDIVKWLFTSPVGTYKVVLFENIQRMNTAATNALLKACEEPAPRTLIIATVDNISHILDTIYSRAFVLRLGPLTDTQIADFLSQEYQHLDPAKRGRIVAFSQGRIGLAKQLADTDDEHIDDGVLSLWSQRNVLQESETSLLADYLFVLQQVKEQGYLSLFLDACLQQSIVKGQGNTNVLLEVNAHLSANGNSDANLLYFALYSLCGYDH